MRLVLLSAPRTGDLLHCRAYDVRSWSIPRHLLSWVDSSIQPTSRAYTYAPMGILCFLGNKAHINREYRTSPCARNTTGMGSSNCRITDQCCLNVVRNPWPCRWVNCHRFNYPGSILFQDFALRSLFDTRYASPTVCGGAKIMPFLFSRSRRQQLRANWNHEAGA